MPELLSLCGDIFDSTNNIHVKAIKSGNKIQSSIIIIDNLLNNPTNESLHINKNAAFNAESIHDIRTHFCNNDFNNDGEYLKVVIGNFLFLFLLLLLLLLLLFIVSLFTYLLLFLLLL